MGNNNQLKQQLDLDDKVRERKRLVYFI